MTGVGRSSGLKRGNPFSDEVIADELPANFRPLTYEYDCTTDHWDHLCRFENLALLHRYFDGEKYHVFLIALTKSSQQ